MARGFNEIAGGARVNGTELAYELAESVLKNDAVGVKATAVATEFTPAFDIAPASVISGIQLNHDETELAIYRSPNQIEIYSISGTTFTKQAAPEVPFPTNSKMKFSPDGKYFVVGDAAPNYVRIYKKVNGAWVKLADPAVLPAAAVNDIAWSGDSNYLMLACAVDQKMMIYSRSGDTFTNLALPAGTMSIGTAAAVDYTGTYFVLGNAATSSYTRMYKRDGTTLTMVKEFLMNVGSVTRLDFSPCGQYLAYGYDNDTVGGLRVYKRVGDDLTSLSIDATASDSVKFVKFDREGLNLYYHIQDTYRHMYTKRNGDKFSTRIIPSSGTTGSYVVYSTLGLKSSMLCSTTVSTPFVRFFNGGVMKLYKAPEISLTDDVGKRGIMKEAGSIGETKKMILLADDI